MKESSAVEVWSPFPPQPSGVADYVCEQLEELSSAFALTLVSDLPAEVDRGLLERFEVVPPEQSNHAALRLYHVGNSPAHGWIYREALRVPGVVVLHEWNLHELVLGLSVTSSNFDDYRLQMRREHGERGSVAADTIASALGGRHWTSLFPLNAEILGQALAVVCLSGSTAARVSARVPGTPLLHLPHHALLRSNASDRSTARARLGFAPDARIVLAPGLATTSKSLEVAREAVKAIRPQIPNLKLVTVGGGSGRPKDGSSGSEMVMGRVDLETLGDALLAADVILALRFPSRGEASGVLMRALAAGRASVVSSGSSADEDLPEGVVARVNPGRTEAQELSAVLLHLLTNPDARRRMERLALETARNHSAPLLTNLLARFLVEVGEQRSGLEETLRERNSRGHMVRERFRDDLHAAASSLGLTHLPSNVFERLAGL